MFDNDALKYYVSQSMKTVFSTQIYIEKALNSKGLDQKIQFELMDECQLLLDRDFEGHKWSKKNYPNGYTSYGSYDQLHSLNSTFKKLGLKVDRHLANYIQQLDYDIKPSDLEMTHCWVNVMPELAQHTAHIHPLSVISGTFYLQIPKLASSIKFEDPRLQCFMNTPPIKSQSKLVNKRFVELKPQEGDVILFESWLKHEVPRNQSTEPRVSISFNYGWKK